MVLANNARQSLLKLRCYATKYRRNALTTDKWRDMLFIVATEILTYAEGNMEKAHFNVRANRSKVMRLGGERKRLNFVERKRILDLQGNKCLYCNREFGSMYMRNGKILSTRLHFDHLIPYSYSQNNTNNFVAVCNICNGIKSNKMFDTVEEVFHYVEYNRKKKGIVYFENEDLSSVPKEIPANTKN